MRSVGEPARVAARNTQRSTKNRSLGEGECADPFVGIEIRGKWTGTILISGSSRAERIGSIVTWRTHARGGTTAGQEKLVEGRNVAGDRYHFLGRSGNARR